MASYTSSTCSGEAVWSSWHSSAYGNGTSSSAVTNGAWESWHPGTSTASSNATYSVSPDIFYTDGVWISWYTDETVGTNVCVRESQQTEVAVPEPAIPRLSYEKLEKKRAKAEEKAKELLLDLIGEEELKVYNETGRLLAKGNKYDYLLEREGVVRRIEKDKVVDLCVHLVTKHRYPMTDNVIALKMLVEDDEETFNKKANFIREYKKPFDLPKCACGGER